MMKNNTTKLMAAVIMVLFIGVFLLLTGRFLYIQAAGEVHDVSLEEWAKEVRTSSYTLPSKRGEILDSNGMTLAYDMPTYRIYAVVNDVYTKDEDDPQHVVDPSYTAQLLAPILEIEESYILERLNKGLSNEKAHQVEFGAVGKGISLQKKDEINALDIPGIGFIEESTRYYPNGMFAPHIIGFAREEKIESEDEDEEPTIEMKGITGIEREMNDILKGVDGFISYERDIFNKKLLDANEVITQPQDGDNIYLTIDQKIQTILEDVMSQVEEQYEPERMTAIVMDPKTGEIVAMGNRPSYNPNNPADVKNWYNDAISSPFEPGSTIKMFTWASAIEEGVYNGTEGFKSGTYRVSDRIQPIHDHNNGKGWGTISYDEGFARSSNVATSKLVWEKLGTDTFREYLNAFHLDEKTEIDLPGEITGEIQYDWPRDKLSTSFGQGSTFTPIQLMKAATAIANDGKMMKPYVIKKIVDSTSNEIIEETKPELVAEPISKETAEEVRRLLKLVVQSDYGTGRMYNIDSYSVAGKTGSAEIPNPEGGYLYGHGNAVYSFLGMAPADDPQLIMYVSVKQPKLDTENGIEYGSAPVSFIFNNVMETSLHYMNIEPDKENNIKNETIEFPDIKNQSVSTIRELLQSMGLRVTVVGSGDKLISSSSSEGEELLPNERVILITDKPTMPNIIDWSLRDVLKLSNLLDLNLQVNGQGYVYEQSIDEGSSISSNQKLVVELLPPNTKLEEEIEEESIESVNEEDNSNPE
ncbi:penicillin-binding protein [Ornithinibacillus halophilus]|uniref:serine-type D-Ala-D-Ala carboxypeptidase n=1 Tax=Ornithinibacillus halophilus TaxID=930117 RepID=A0A1M5C3Y3_9BACI|nr:penicillin-binding protein [Ornithinibacillus halophilus]SHF49390.1 penicillin-binding protein 2B [Ornithinibacillus halophilus]